MANHITNLVYMPPTNTIFIWPMLEVVLEEEKQDEFGAEDGG